MKHQALGLDPLLFMLTAEAMKLMMSLLMFAVFDSRSGVGWRVWSGGHVMLFPAVCYLLMNVLSFYSLRRISSSMFATIAELKLIFTAVFHSLLFGPAPAHKWVGLAMIFSGGMLILLQEKATPFFLDSSDEGVFHGVLAAIAIQMLSAFASIFLEKILKLKSLPETLWQRNIQLTSISLLMYLLLYLLAPNPPHLRLYFSWALPDVLLLLLVSTSSLTASLCAKYLNSVVKCILASVAFGVSLYISSIVYHTPFSSSTAMCILLITLGVLNYSFEMPFDFLAGMKGNGDLESQSAKHAALFRGAIPNV